MNSLVIEAPDLQTPAQKTATYMISGFGWLLWLYVSFPLITVCGYLMHVGFCSVLIDRVGGAWSLRSLLQLYGMTLVGIACTWTLWILYRLKTRHKDVRSSRPQIVSDEALCLTYQVSSESLQATRVCRAIDVDFDSQGKILALIPKVSCADKALAAKSELNKSTLLAAETKDPAAVDVFGLLAMAQKTLQTQA